MLLLDTCTFIWLTSDPTRLSPCAVKSLEAENELGLSDVCIWEICLKWQAKKIELPDPPRAWVSDQMRAWNLQRVPMEIEHFYRSTELPDLHRDPFDRLLISQALANNLRIVTPDPAIKGYPVTVVW